MDLTIDGIGTVPSNRAEYTSGSVLKKYLDNIAILNEIFNRRSSNPDASSTPLSPADFDRLMAALNELRDLAKNGVTDGNPPLTFYMTGEMATNLDLVLRSLKAGGIMLDTGYQDADKVTLLESWQSLAGFGVQQIMNAAGSVSTSSTRTLQSMVELEYVKQGNDLLAIKFQNLEQSLKTTQGILDSLTIIQGISNQITVTNRGDFAFPPGNDNQIPSAAIAQIQNVFNQITDGKDNSDMNGLVGQMRNFTNSYNASVTAARNAAANNPNTTFSAEMAKLNAASNIMNNVLTADWTSSSGSGKGSSTQNLTLEYYTRVYKVVASAQFRQVFPTATPTSTAATELLAAKQKLYERLLDLEKISPDNTRSVEGTLANFIYKVINDISNAFKNLTATSSPDQLKAAVSKWILDNQDQRAGAGSSNDAGAIQDRITQAIKAAQSLNDTEKENVRNYQFVFQQFYQSAATVLQKVTQIVEKLAQGIAR